MIKIIQGDITTLAVDAIVNAANQVMLGGGGVDGAIHDAAGEELFKACLKVPEVRSGVRCPTGEARITPGFKLPAKFVIHTVGPVYRDGQHGEPEKLAACYRNALALAAENGCKSIAFPCISTGVRVRLSHRGCGEDCGERGEGVFSRKERKGRRARGRVSSRAVDGNHFLLLLGAGQKGV